MAFREMERGVLKSATFDGTIDNNYGNYNLNLAVSQGVVVNVQEYHNFRGVPFCSQGGSNFAMFFNSQTGNLLPNGTAISGKYYYIEQ